MPHSWLLFAADFQLPAIIDIFPLIRFHDAAFFRRQLLRRHAG
jgi:hypothetical protein